MCSCQDYVLYKNNYWLWHFYINLIPLMIVPVQRGWYISLISSPIPIETTHGAKFVGVSLWLMAFVMSSNLMPQFSTNFGSRGGINTQNIRITARWIFLIFIFTVTAVAILQYYFLWADSLAWVISLDKAYAVQTGPSLVQVLVLLVPVFHSSLKNFTQ